MNERHDDAPEVIQFAEIGQVDGITGLKAQLPTLGYAAKHVGLWRAEDNTAVVYAFPGTGQREGQFLVAHLHADGQTQLYRCRDWAAVERRLERLPMTPPPLQGTEEEDGAG